jgi:hypothetical protein
MAGSALLTQLDAAVGFRGVFIPAHHSAKPESCLAPNPTSQPQHLTAREEGTLGIERPCFEPAAVELLASASEGIARTINLVARAAWIQAAKDKSLQISATHIQSALELVPGVMELRQRSPHP